MEIPEIADEAAGLSGSPNITYVIELSRWGPDDIEDRVFESRQSAVEAVKVVLQQMDDGGGFWRSCPDSHAGGCKWRKVNRVECDVMGWSIGATDVWAHRRRSGEDRHHAERISIFPRVETA